MRLALALATALTLSAITLGCGSKETAPPAPSTPPSTAKATRSARPTKTNLPDLVATIRSGVVRIEVVTCDGEGVGTGFLLGPRLVATVEHVIDGATTITLKRSGKVLGGATVVGADAARDLALLRTSRAVRGHHFKIASRPPRLGEEVAALGFPLGLPLTVTRGLVSGSDRSIPIEGIKRRKLVQTDAAVNFGNSGGPLISTETGEVVGLVDLGTTEANGLAFAVSAQVARPLLEAWRVAPQPISAADCGLSQGAPEAAPSPPSGSDTGLASFDGKYFSIAYPSYWEIDSAEVSRGSYFDTTIRNPGDRSILLRVDVNPNAPEDVEANARSVVAALSRQPGYRELAYERVNFDGYDAIYWEFLVTESGVPLHKVDIFFVDQYGEGFGVLTQAPVRAWGSWAPVFEAIRESLYVPRE